MKRCLLTLTTSVFGAAVCVLAMAPPAFADTTCDNDYVCVWEGANYSGTKHAYQAHQFPIDFYNGGAGFMARSAKNRLYDNTAVYIGCVPTLLLGVVTAGSDWSDIPSSGTPCGSFAWGRYAALRYGSYSLSQTDAYESGPGQLTVEYTLTNTGGNYTWPGFAAIALIRDDFDNSGAVVGSAISSIDEPNADDCDYLASWGDGGPGYASSAWACSMATRAVDPSESVTIRVVRDWYPLDPWCGETLTADTRTELTFSTTWIYPTSHIGVIWTNGAAQGGASPEMILDAC